jgi:tetratricopeptide (TPR) repeat protein
MKRLGPGSIWLLGLLPICGVAAGGKIADRPRDTTASVISIANLDQQIAQLREEPGIEELLLVRSRFLGDYEALDRASRLTELRFETGPDLLRRARTRSAVHRFGDALADLSAAESAGVKIDKISAQRASILVATGRTEEVIPQLEEDVARHPGYASRGTLAGAYATLGRLDAADRLYVAALSDLDTTLPFPYAWIYFARGLMWAERGEDPARAEIFYKQALIYLPEFVGANINLAELETARGDAASAMDRLSRVVSSSNEPEALALLGALHVRTGDVVAGKHEISLARQRFESLLALYPLAFADHAAEFYLGPGAYPERAWMLAEQNLANRDTDRAVALAVKAAEATGRYAEACTLLRKHGPSVQIYLRSLNGKLAQ